MGKSQLFLALFAGSDGVTLHQQSKRHIDMSGSFNQMEEKMNEDGGMLSYANWQELEDAEGSNAGRVGTDDMQGLREENNIQEEREIAKAREEDNESDGPEDSDFSGDEEDDAGSSHKKKPAIAFATRASKRLHGRGQSLLQMKGHKRPEHEESETESGEGSDSDDDLKKPALAALKAKKSRRHRGHGKRRHVARALVRSSKKLSKKRDDPFVHELEEHSLDDILAEDGGDALIEDVMECFPGVEDPEALPEDIPADKQECVEHAEEDFCNDESAPGVCDVLDDMYEDEGDYNMPE